mgnify:CR=1 FL=1
MSDLKYVAIEDGQGMLFINNCEKNLVAVDVDTDHQISSVMFKIKQGEAESLAFHIQMQNQLMETK